MTRAWLLLVAGCWSGSSTATTPVAPAPVKPAAPALFAELIAPHRTWTLPGEFVSGHDGQTQTETGTVTCTTDATVITKGWRVELHCDGMPHATKIDATYVITKAGMWLADSEDEELTPDKLQLAVPPVAYETRDEHDDNGFSYGIVRKATPSQGEGWCIEYDSWGGDEDGRSLCIEAGKGITGATAFFSGGFSDDLYVGDVQRH